MTYEQMQLIRRTAWMNIQLLDKGPRPEDAKYVPRAVRMLTLVACMGYAVLDLEEALSRCGKLRHEVKVRMKQVKHLTEYAHGTAFEMLHKVSDEAARMYNDRMDETYRRIFARILLPEPEKSYNIVVALCRLIEKYNGQISGRYDFNPAKPLYKVPALIACAGIEDHHLDGIIELNMK